VDKWIFGSTRIELEPAERGVFVDLMALGAKDKGYIRANETTPYLLPQLAGLLNISVELLQSTIQKCIQVGKIDEPILGIYHITNWDKYQFTERYKKMLKNKHNSKQFRKNGNDVPKNGNYNIIKDNTVQDKKEKNNIIPPISPLKSGDDVNNQKQDNTSKPIKRFIKPSIDEIRSYCQERNNGIDAEQFWNFYESKGWVVGKSPMKDWRAAVRTWERGRNHSGGGFFKDGKSGWVKTYDRDLDLIEQAVREREGR
jgi:hypothetical protein